MKQYFKIFQFCLQWQLLFVKLLSKQCSACIISIKYSTHILEKKFNYIKLILLIILLTMHSGDGFSVNAMLD